MAAAISKITHYSFNQELFWQFVRIFACVLDQPWEVQCRLFMFFFQLNFGYNCTPQAWF
jgi:hypothetical protein